MVRRVVDSGDIEVLDLTVPPTDERIPGWTTSADIFQHKSSSNHDYEWRLPRLTV